MVELYNDNILSVKKNYEEENVLYYHFTAPKGIRKNRLISVFLQYFIPEFSFYSKEALINLLELATEQCNGNVTESEKIYFNSLRQKARHDTIIKIIWNKILLGEGLSYQN